MSFIDDAIGVASVFSPSTALFAGQSGNKTAGNAFQAVDGALEGGGQLALDVAEMVPGLGLPLSLAETGYHLAHGAYDLGSGNDDAALAQGGKAGVAALSAVMAGAGGGGAPGMVERAGLKAMETSSLANDGKDWLMNMYHNFAD